MPVNVTGIIDACDRKFRLLGLDALTAKQRLVVLASWANVEIELGGVGAFFHNAAGTFSKEVVDALIALGAMDEAAAIHRGRELLRTHSWHELAASSQFERLTDKYLASMPGVSERLGAFVRLHERELAEAEQYAAADEAETRLRP
jgi:hypothetical protein